MAGQLILVGDRNPGFLAKSEEILMSAGFRMIAFADGRMGKDLLQRENPAGVLVHAELPVMNGLELCRFVKTEFNPTLPVVLMTSDDDTSIQACTNVGADNVLIRPIKREELVFAARTLVRLRQIAQVPLPAGGAPGASSANPAPAATSRDGSIQFEFFKSFFLAVEIKRARRYGFPLSVMLMILDGVDDVRQQQGPEVTGRLLEGLALVIRRSVRDIDIPVTLRDESILIVMPHTDGRGAQSVAERVQARVRRSVYRDKPILIRPTISIGETTYIKHRDRNFSQVIRRASDAMDQAIRQGGDQLVVL